MTSPAPVRVTALYHFTPFDDLEAVRGPLARLCCSLDVKGTLLLANEGINGTIAGAPEAIDAVLEHIRALPGCGGIDFKDSYARTMPFLRMKVRLKKEIVTLGVPGIDAARDAGTHVDPADWNALIAQPDVVLIDTRNAYEVAIGTFEGAVDPKTDSFSDFPAWFRAFRQGWGEAKPKVAMFCTGGIRCEKATAFLKAEGVEEVFHLKGGILKYLETVPQAASAWRGECFVFDQRTAVKHGLEVGEHTLCHGCRMPVSAADRASPLYVEGVSCPACHGRRDDGRRERYAERMRQMRHTAKLGMTHLGVTTPEAKARHAAKLEARRAAAERTARMKAQKA
ncbi:rhodanese-related sulfurtransferase [Caulobacter segnis]|uniref:oxygen-dependent tRNA uridine(34) hydroxylase TrhO n=1 Tax=Caulobacter segnis TaxID=88688 RepID=UPI00240F49F2|nr:rhodanese-related sulfurtransferase [Caulobacter segnis]MDG2521258.1 rhodanese-related sulfurtransferase [Caulobacter segnis]